MMNKSSLGWVSNHSTSNLTTGINLPNLGKAFNFERRSWQDLACTESTASGPTQIPSRQAGSHVSTVRLLFSHPLQYTLSWRLSLIVSAKSWSRCFLKEWSLWCCHLAMDSKYNSYQNSFFCLQLNT